MDRRTSAALISVGALAALLVPSLTGTAVARSPHDSIPSTFVTWCSSSPAPCIESATDNGTAITEADSGTYDVSGAMFTSDGATEIQWGVDKNGAGITDPTLPAGENQFSSLGNAEIGHTWSLNFDLGNAFIPRVTGTYGDNVTINRAAHNDGTYNITVTGDVVRQAVNAECDTSTPDTMCPVQSGADIAAFQGEISDFGQWEDAAQRADFYGLDSWTNVEYTSTPPSVVGDPLTISAPLADSYKCSNGDVVQGFYHVRIPNHFLQDMGIDDPTTIDPAGVDAQVGGGTVTVTPGANAVAVDATNISFAPASGGGARGADAATRKHSTNHQLKVKRGTITPKPPKHVKAKRHGSTAKLTFAKRGRAGRR